MPLARTSRPAVGLYLMGTLLAAITLPAAAAPLILEQRVDQYDFFTAPVPVASNTAFAEFSVTALGDSTAMSYLNLVAKDAVGAEHWLVQNLPILPMALNPGRTTFTTSFDLRPFVSSGSNLASLNYGTVVSADVATATPTVSFATQAVGDALLDARGKGDAAGATHAAPASPSGPQTVVFTTPFLHVRYRPGFPNVEQAPDECGPGSAANSLQWLADTQGLKLDDTLDARLDDLVGRMDTNRPAEPFDDGSNGQPANGTYDPGEDFEDRNGNGAFDPAKPATEDHDFITGKLSYDDAKGLDVKFMDDQLGGADITLFPGGPTARARGTTPTAQFIFDELNADEDVEIGMTFVVPEAFVDGSNGQPANGTYDPGEDFVDRNGNGTYDTQVLDSGHWITATGKIDLFGVKGIWFVEDQHQGLDTDEAFVDGSNGQPKNGKYDPGEDFTDENGDGTWTDSGTHEVGFSWLGTRDDGFMDGYLTLLNYGGDEVIDIVVSESVPAPSTWASMSAGLLLLVANSGRRRRGRFTSPTR